MFIRFQWFSVFLMRLISIVFLATNIVIFVHFSINKFRILDFYNASQQVLFSVVLAFVIMLYIYQLVQLFYSQSRSKKRVSTVVAIGVGSSSTSEDVQIKPAFSKTAEIPVKRSSSKCPKMSQWFCVRFLSDLLGVDGIFGRHGSHYEARVFVSGIIELMAETFQAYRFSMYTHSLGFVMGCMTLITCNCIFKLMRMQSDNDAIRRNASILLDAIFNVSFIAILPFYTIIKSHSFNLILAPQLFDLTGEELEYFLLTKGIILNVGFAAIVCFASFMALHFILLDLSVSAEEDFGRIWSMSKPSSMRSISIDLKADTTSSHRAKTVTVIDNLLSKMISNGSRKIKILNFLFFSLWITVFWAICITAVSRKCPSWCKQQRYKWFTNSCSCVHGEFSCNEASNIGDTKVSLPFLELHSCIGHDIDELLVKFCDMNILSIDTFDWVWSNESLTELHSLIGLSLRNSTMTELPEGLEDIPTHLKSLRISETNLSYLPMGLDIKWNKLTHLELAYGEFEVFPGPLLMLVGLTSLDFTGNKLTSIPRHIDCLISIETLVFTLNNIVAIPEEIGHLKYLKNFYIDGNQVEELPIGLKTNTPEISISHNPICETNEGRLEDPFNDSDSNILVCCALIYPDYCYEDFDSSNTWSLKESEQRRRCIGKFSEFGC